MYALILLQCGSGGRWVSWEAAAATCCVLCLPPHKFLEGSLLLFPHVQCIVEWTELQRRQAVVASAPPAFACPLCRQAFTALVHDCRGPTDFIRQWVVEPRLRGSASGGSAAAATLQLTVAHRRRRAVYSTQPDPGQLRRLRAAAITPVLAARPEVATWVERELQALMQQADVSLVAHHLAGTLRAAAQPPKAGPGRPPSRGSAGKGIGPAVAAAAGAGVGGRRDVLPGPRGGARLAVAPGRGLGAPVLPAGVHVADILPLLEAAARPFLSEQHYKRFAWEFAAFAASGASIVAADGCAMQAGGAAAAAAVADARARIARRGSWWREDQQEQQQLEATATEGSQGHVVTSDSSEQRPEHSAGDLQCSNSEDYVELVRAQYEHSQQQRRQWLPAEPGEASSAEHHKSKRRREDQRGTGSSDEVAVAVEEPNGSGEQLAASRRHALQSLQRCKQ